MTFFGSIPPVDRRVVDSVVPTLSHSSAVGASRVSPTASED
jgi:hypothetical protein